MYHLYLLCPPCEFKLATGLPVTGAKTRKVILNLQKQLFKAKLNTSSDYQRHLEH